MTSCTAYEIQSSEESQQFGAAPSPYHPSPAKSFAGNSYPSSSHFNQQQNYLSTYDNPYQHFYVPQQSAPSFAASSQSSESGLDTSSTVNSFQAFQTVNASTPIRPKLGPVCSGGTFPPPVDYSDSRAAEETKPRAAPMEVEQSQQFAIEEVPTKADDGSDLSSVNSNPEQQTFMKQDPSQGKTIKSLIK